MKQVNWDKLENKIEDFKELKSLRKEVRKELHDSSSTLYKSTLLRIALSQGFYMNSCRKVPSGSEHSYITVNEGFLVKLDRGNSNVFALHDYYPDWLIYTDLSGSQGGQSGLIKMAFEIDLSWIKDKIPRLKDIDVN